MKKRRLRNRPSVDRLEDRTVMSVDLTTVFPMVNSSYSTFAVSVRAAELTLLPQTGSSLTTTPTGSSVGAQVVSSILTLEQSLASELKALPTASALIFQQLDANGLGIRMADLFNAAGSQTSDGTVPQSDLILLFSAVDAEMAASLQQTTDDLFLAASPTPTGTTGTATPASDTFPTGTPAGAQVEYAILGLEATLASELTEVPTASALIFQQLDANGLGLQMANLFSAASSSTTDGTTPPASLPLLYTAVDAEMVASLQQTEGDIVLDDLSQAKGSSINLSTINGEVNTAYSTFATLVRTAETSIATTPTTPTLTANGFVTEAGTSGTTTADFLITLSSASTSPVTLNYATADGTAIAGTDYTATSGTLTFAPGTTAMSIPVTILGETTSSPDKTFTLNLTDPGNASITTSTVTGEILYGSVTPVISVSSPSTNVPMTGTATLAFVVSLSAPTDNEVMVDYATADGTAVTGADYSPTSGVLTFSPGTTSQTIDVTAYGEPTTAPSKTVILNLTGATNTSNTTVTATGTLNYALSPL